MSPFYLVAYPFSSFNETDDALKILRSDIEMIPLNSPDEIDQLTRIRAVKALLRRKVTRLPSRNKSVIDELADRYTTDAGMKPQTIAISLFSFKNNEFRRDSYELWQILWFMFDKGSTSPTGMTIMRTIPLPDDGYSEPLTIDLRTDMKPKTHPEHWKIGESWSHIVTYGDYSPDINQTILITEQSAPEIDYSGMDLRTIITTDFQLSAVVNPPNDPVYLWQALPTILDGDGLIVYHFETYTIFRSASERLFLTFDTVHTMIAMRYLYDDSFTNFTRGLLDHTKDSMMVSKLRQKYLTVRSSDRIDMLIIPNIHDHYDQAFIVTWDIGYEGDCGGFVQSDNREFMNRALFPTMML